MPVISIITPVHAATAAFVGEAYRSLAVQQLSPDWEMEWLVQADGPVDLEQLPDEPWISTGTGRPGGAARARTLALARAGGVLLRQLDADDLLPDPRTLARDIHTLTNSQTIAWVVSPCLNLHEDGSTTPGPYDPQPGPLAPRTLLNGLLDDRFPVMGTTVTLYTELARALGAWPALPYGQDVALSLNAEAVSPGWMQQQPGELYRQHSGRRPGCVRPRRAVSASRHWRTRPTPCTRRAGPTTRRPRIFATFRACPGTTGRATHRVRADNRCRPSVQVDPRRTVVAGADISGVSQRWPGEIPTRKLTRSR